jgi:hypothetical protein
MVLKIEVAQNNGPHIGHLPKLKKILLKRNQHFILFLPEIINYRYAIFEVAGIGLNLVVDNNNVCERSIVEEDV